MKLNSVPKILCIDDDARTADWVRVVLKSSNIKCSLVTVKTGREAFRRLNSENFDLCILEYALPDMTGVQLCSLMRHLRCEVPMLFFSAMNRPVDREKAMKAGATEYLSKPDGLDMFADTVRHLLAQNPGRRWLPSKSQPQYARAA